MKASLGEECLGGLCRKNWPGKNGSEESTRSRARSLSLQALASADKDLLVEQETRALQVLVDDTEGTE